VRLITEFTEPAQISPSGHSSVTIWYPMTILGLELAQIATACELPFEGGSIEAREREFAAELLYVFKIISHTFDDDRTFLSENRALFLVIDRSCINTLINDILMDNAVMVLCRKEGHIHSQITKSHKRTKIFCSSIINES
jgi:hypothetical protein